jgi:hypothetical protein
MWLGPTVLHWRAGLVAELPGATNWETFFRVLSWHTRISQQKAPPTRQNVKPDLQLLDDPPSPANRNNG